MLLGDVFLMAVYTGLVCVRKKVSMAVFLKKVFPVFMIGLTTASSAAAFLENRKVCAEKLGIDKKIVNIGVPLGQVVFMPGFSILYFVMGICMAEIYGVKISPVWLITALIIAVVLAVATPPIPGGALACYTILLLQLEIPAQAIAIAVAINVRHKNRQIRIDHQLQRTREGAYMVVDTSRDQRSRHKSDQYCQADSHHQEIHPH